MTRRVIVDETHCGRHVTGLERITLELFSRDALAPLDVVPVRAAGRRGMVAKQNATLPWRALAERRSLVLCPGFPPSPLLLIAGGRRVIPYVHDLFLLTRPQDLNRRARYYMAPPFRFMVKRAPLFLVNSQATASDLRRFCRPDAEILLYRPPVRNVFELSAAGRAERPEPAGSLRLVAVGTVEPRKNLPAAAALLTALRRTSHPEARLDIVGRFGWGVDMAALERTPGVTLHGYQPTDVVRRLITEADALLSTSHDEGLGLPLLEMQYAGLAVIAPDQPVFREVLGESGTFIDPSAPERAAGQVAATIATPRWRPTSAAAALANLDRWNRSAVQDRADVVARLQRM